MQTVITVTVKGKHFRFRGSTRFGLLRVIADQSQHGLSLVTSIATHIRLWGAVRVRIWQPSAALRVWPIFTYMDYNIQLLPVYQSLDQTLCQQVWVANWNIASRVWLSSNFNVFLYKPNICIVLLISNKIKTLCLSDDLGHNVGSDMAGKNNRPSFGTNTTWLGRSRVYWVDLVAALSGLHPLKPIYQLPYCSKPTKWIKGFNLMYILLLFPGKHGGHGIQLLKMTAVNKVHALQTTHRDFSICLLRLRNVLTN